MFCPGEYQLSGTHFRCHGTHGKINLLRAIQHSCDGYFWKLAERIGISIRISGDIAREYGLGAPTNLGLNGDSPGRIPTKAWYEANGRYKVGYATNAAIRAGRRRGHEVLQMAMAYATIANGGTLYVPQVVERVESPTTATRSTRISRRSRAPSRRRPMRSRSGSAACGRSPTSLAAPRSSTVTSKV